MSHRILIEALRFVTPELHHTTDNAFRVVLKTFQIHNIVTLLMTQRQLFNSLAPRLPGERKLLTSRFSPAACLQLLMRADTFRFATSLCVEIGMTAAATQEVLRKMDCVIDVELRSHHLGDDLTETLMSLPHLERLSLDSCHRMTYYGTLRPLLRHPRESVRRSVSASEVSNVFETLQTEQYIAAFRNDIIPLIDSASCNGAIVDFLHLVSCSHFFFERLPADVIMMLGERLFQFFTAANSHSRLVDQSLDLLGLLAATSMRSDRERNTLNVVVDVFKEWPVLERLTEMLPTLPSTAAMASVTYGIFAHPFTQFRGASAEVIRHRRNLFLEHRFPDIIYDAVLARTLVGCCGGLGSSVDLYSCLFYIAGVDPVGLITKTSVIQKELKYFLTPWHRAVMAQVLRYQRRGESVVDERGQFVIPFDEDDFERRARGGEWIIEALLNQWMEDDDDDDASAQVSQEVMRLLFDEKDGLNVGPVLRNYVIASRGTRRQLTYFFYLSPRAAKRERRRARRARKEDDARRCYLSEFLDSVGVQEADLVY